MIVLNISVMKIAKRKSIQEYVNFLILKYINIWVDTKYNTKNVSTLIPSVEPFSISEIMPNINADNKLKASGLRLSQKYIPVQKGAMRMKFQKDVLRGMYAISSKNIILNSGMRNIYIVVKNVFRALFIPAP